MKKMKFSDCGDFERKLVNYIKFIGNQTNPTTNELTNKQLTQKQKDNT